MYKSVLCPTDEETSIFNEFFDDNVDVTVFVLLMLSLFGNSCCTIWIRRRIVQLRAKANLDTTDNRGLLEMSSRDETVFDETLQARDCREKFLAEYEALIEQKRTFEAEMKSKHNELARKQNDFMSKMKKETENLQDFADRLLAMEQTLDGKKALLDEEIAKKNFDGEFSKDSLDLSVTVEAKEDESIESITLPDVRIIVDPPPKKVIEEEMEKNLEELSSKKTEVKDQWCGLDVNKYKIYY